ncbi:hypothetical protein KIPB_003985, partial [Kipferlia bialata]|eukprot:g3985.t1
MDSDMGDYDAASVAEALPYIPHVTSIGLHRNRIGDAGAITLSKTIHELTRLDEVYFTSNDMGSSGATALCEALCRLGSELKGLGFDGMPIGDSGTVSLCRSLPSLSGLTLLELGGTDMGDVGASAMADVLPHLPMLTRLNLSSNHIGDEGAFSLSEALPALPKLEMLWLQDNLIGSDGQKVLASTMSDLPCLQSSSLGIGFQGWEDWEYGVSPELVLAVRTARLEGERDFKCEKLKLDTSTDIEALSEALVHLRHIERLWIGADPIGDAGVTSLAEHLPSLTKLTS